MTHTDDFVCQECTQWSGLGAIDILAGVIDISANPFIDKEHRGEAAGRSEGRSYEHTAGHESL